MNAKTLATFYGSLALLAVAGFSGRAGAQSASPVPSATFADAFVAMSRSAGWSDDERRAVEAMAARDPAILDAAAKKVAGRRNPQALLESPTAADARALKREFVLRASLQAISEGLVVVDDRAARRLASFLPARASPGLPDVSLALGLKQDAISAMSRMVQVIRPSCPSGLTAVFVLGQKACIEGDPWSESLFRGVVPINVDGRRACTGTMIGPGTILTAAHCVIEEAGGGVSVVDARRISVGALAGGSVPLVASPSVPAKMLKNCMPLCQDLAFDFAVLKVDRALARAFNPVARPDVLGSTGRTLITLAGYGETTMPAQLSKTGLYIGSQTLSLQTVEQPLEWTYSVSGTTTSSFCSGDSGGPIFLGKPRKDGDALQVIGVISHFVDFGDRSRCLHAHATAVNLTRHDVRAEFCNLAGTDQPGCG